MVGTHVEALGPSTFRLGSGNRSAFVKCAPAAEASRLSGEANGLRAIGETLRVPGVLGEGTADGAAWLALEWLDLQRAESETAAAFGRTLAALHRRTADAFGWDGDNWIGAAVQHNGWLRDWAGFFGQRRLRPQLETAAYRGSRALVDAGRIVLERLPRLLAGHDPAPSLIHGDLWGGNWGALADGTPVTFDPAVHYADRECDLAMTELFGGFPDAFYAAYREAWPLTPGYAERRDLYQLYHVLNHCNLFGDAYEQQALTLIRRLRRRV